MCERVQSPCCSPASHGSGLPPLPLHTLCPSQIASISLCSNPCRYAFGVILWELIAWEIPYTGVNTWLVRRGSQHAQPLRSPPCSKGAPSRLGTPAEFANWPAPSQPRPRLPQIAKAIVAGERLAVPPRDAQPGRDRLPPDIEHDYVQLMQRCWAQAPEERPRFDDVAATLR